MKKLLLLLLCTGVFGVNGLRAEEGETLEINVSDKTKNTVSKALALKNKDENKNLTAKDITTLTVIGGPFVKRPGTDVRDTGEPDITSIFSGIGHLKELKTLDMGSAVVGSSEFVVGFLSQNHKKLTSVILPEGTKKIRNGAFLGLPISAIILPGTIEIIEPRAFKDCSNLKVVTGKWKNNPPAVSSDVFSGTPGDKILYVPVGSKQGYIDKGWKTFTIMEKQEEPQKTGEIYDKTNAPGERVTIHMKNNEPKFFPEVALERYHL